MSLPDMITGIIMMEDIDRGVRADSHACPLACALKRMGYRPAVAVYSVWLAPDAPTGASETYDMDTGLRASIARFDDGLGMKPQPFLLTKHKEGTNAW
jgi:hypothetical protein